MPYDAHCALSQIYQSQKPSTWGSQIFQTFIEWLVACICIGSPPPKRALYNLDRLSDTTCTAYARCDTLTRNTYRYIYSIQVV